MSQPSWIGRTISDRYVIEELIGQGGMSAVYKATDPNLKRVVAVKLIHGHLSSNPEFVRRFEEEAAAVAQLRHPNIIQVYDFNNDGDTYYIVFEFIPGESLQARLKRLNDAGRRMPLGETVKVAASISEALDYAHGRGLIHRDIKPANVMLNVQGQAILMDFGIVKMLGGQSHTATGAVLGTARYMSPEQIQGKQVDARTDIYAMGVMLYEMVGGRPPYQADSAMTLMMMHVNDPIPDVRSVRPDVPPDMVSVIRKTLAKDRSDRYQTAGELNKALRTIQLEGPTAPAAAPPSPEATILEQTPPKPPVQATILEAPSPTPAPPPARAETAAPRPTARPPAASPGTAAPAAAPRPTPAKPAESGNRRRIMIGAGILAVLLVVCLAGAAILYGVLGSGDNGQDTETPVAAATADQAATQQFLDGEATSAALTAEAQAIVEATSQIAPESTATNAPQPTNTPPPTETLEPVYSPTPEPTDTPPPSPSPFPEPYVLITNIGIDSGRYVVTYETYGYEPALPGVHIHFFWDTVPPERAGVGPNQLTWVVYGGPNPFTLYAVTDRPGAATQMCALVANTDHTVQLGTGNCFDLPGL